MATGFDYEGMAYEAAREGKVNEALVWATLFQGSMTRELAEIMKAIQQGGHEQPG